MNRTMRKAAGAGSLSVLCAVVGVAFGGQRTDGPCVTDSTNTCTIKCAPITGTNRYVASADTTQLPYCKGDPLVPGCDPKAQFILCSQQQYTNSTCNVPVGSGPTNVATAACK